MPVVQRPVPWASAAAVSKTPPASSAGANVVHLDIFVSSPSMTGLATSLLCRRAHAELLVYARPMGRIGAEEMAPQTSSPQRGIEPVTYVTGSKECFIRSMPEGCSASARKLKP
jgi:hypothetical protein